MRIRTRCVADRMALVAAAPPSRLEKFATRTHRVVPAAAGCVTAITPASPMARFVLRDGCRRLLATKGNTMRHIMIAGLGLLLATQAFAQGSTTAKSRAEHKADAAAAYDGDRAVTPTDVNAPSNHWGKKEAPESKPRPCSYDGAMSDEDIERCRR